MAGKNADLRNTYRRRKLATEFKARCKRQCLACHLCGQSIDYDAPTGTPSSFDADHFYPLATHPHLAFEMSNLRPAHCKCNRSRGAKPVTRDEWVQADF